MLAERCLNNAMLLVTEKGGRRHGVCCRGGAATHAALISLLALVVWSSQSTAVARRLLDGAATCVNTLGTYNCQQLFPDLGGGPNPCDEDVLGLAGHVSDSELQTIRGECARWCQACTSSDPEPSYPPNFPPYPPNPSPPPSLPAPTYLGCYAEKKPSKGEAVVDWVYASRALPSLLRMPALTPAACQAYAMSVGSPLFALQYGKECWTGGPDLTVATATRYGPSAKCTLPCLGDSSSVCGGPWALSLYAVPPLAPPQPPKPPRPFASPSLGGTNWYSYIIKASSNCQLALADMNRFCYVNAAMVDIINRPKNFVCATAPCPTTPSACKFPVAGTAIQFFCS